MFSSHFYSIYALVFLFASNFQLQWAFNWWTILSIVRPPLKRGRKPLDTVYWFLVALNAHSTRHKLAGYESIIYAPFFLFSNCTHQRTHNEFRRNAFGNGCIKCEFAWFVTLVMCVCACVDKLLTIVSTKHLNMASDSMDVCCAVCSMQCAVQSTFTFIAFRNNVCMWPNFMALVFNINVYANSVDTNCDI